MISKKILDSIYTGICIIHRDFTVYAWNRLLEDITGLTLSDFKNKKIYEVCNGFNEETIKMRLQMVMDSKIPIVFSAQLHKNLYKTEKSDSDRFLETTVSSINIGANEDAVILTVKDVTELTLQVIKYRDMKDRALALANSDNLTGLYNRKFIRERIAEEIKRKERFNRPFSIMIADIDFFKKVNDTYGHNCGDAVLKTVSNILNSNIRSIDTLARWGGEEFLFLLPETEKVKAFNLAEKLRKEIMEQPVSFDEKSINITITFGISQSSDDINDMDDIIRLADDALYKGKREGRNQTVIG